MATEKLLAQNRRWATRKAQADPDYFKRLSSGQAPPVFWIGCCDSRVAPWEMLGASLGELFAHTTIANQLDTTNAACMSALEYALGTLGVAHLVVCGHTGCGGIKAATADTAALPPNVRDWINPLTKLYADNKTKLPPDNDAMLTALAELNVKQQVEKIAELGLVRDLWKAGKGPAIHGWMFHLEDGRVEEIAHQRPPG